MRRFLAHIVPRSLAARIGAALLLVGLLPILVAWGANYIQSQEPKDVDAYILLLADYAAQNVRQALEQSITAVETVAQDGAVRDYQERRAAVEKRLVQFNGLFPLFHHLTLVDLNGYTVASSTYRYRGEWRKLSVFQQAASGEVAISAAHLTLGSGEPMIGFASPVRDPEGQVIGVLAGEVPVASVAPQVTGLQVGKEGHAFLVNSVGQVIAHRDAERLMENWDLPGLEALSSPVLITLDDGTKNYLYSIAPVKADGMQEEWKVVLRTLTTETYVYYNRTQRVILLLSIGMLLNISVVAAGLAISISRPVRRVTVAARQMAMGQLTTRVEGSAGGELGELATSFNSMAQELEAKIQALQKSRARIVAVQEGVRREIAAHLHGRVQARLLALKGRLQEFLKEKSRLSEEVQLLGPVVDEMDWVIQQEVSVLSRQLYPSILRRGLIPALQSLGDQFEAILTIEIELDEGLVHQERTDHNLVPEQVRLAAYRLAEEALTNVVKHAKTSQVTIELTLPSPQQLRLTVRDNGQGFDMENVRSGLGMVAMQDYAEALGGMCIVHSTPDKGTEVIATLPLAGSGIREVERGSS